MRVSIDFQSAIGQRSGVGRYTYELTRHLPGCAGAGDSVSAFYFDFMRRGFGGGGMGGVEMRGCHWMPGRVAGGLWEVLGWPRYEHFAGGADIYHFPGFIRPPLGDGAKSVVTIHDVSFLRMPETTEEKNLRWLTGHIGESVERADAILTDSHFSAGEIEELLGVSREKIFPVWLGLGHGVCGGGEGEAAARRAYGLEGSYLLMVGTLEPRKNISFLVEVFDALDTFGGELVLVGGEGWKCGKIFDAIRGARKAGKIRWLRFVPEGLLGGLYTGAEALIYPSLYEGFGFPPLEAAARGTPVVCARNSALPEVMGEAAVWVDGFEVEVWRAAIVGLLGDEGARGRLVRAGRERAKLFCWEETARRTWEVYRRVAGGGGQG